MRFISVLLQWSRLGKGELPPGRRANIFIREGSKINRKMRDLQWRRELREPSDPGVAELRPPSLFPSLVLLLHLHNALSGAVVLSMSTSKTNNKNKVGRIF
jgi:hypothetical protein